MNRPISKSQIDQLGVRLKAGNPQHADIRLLDEYRRSFDEAYAHVVTTIRDRLKLQPTGRPAKSTTSIIEKLQRETIRLSQVQDIAGCRVLVRDMAHQDHVVARLRKVFVDTVVIDRRGHASHGYRAQDKLLESAILVAVFERAEVEYGPKSRQGGEPSTIRRNRAILNKLKHNIVEYLNFSLLSDILEEGQ